MSKKTPVELTNIKIKPVDGEVKEANGNVGSEEKDDKEGKKEENKRIATFKELFRTATCTDVLLMVAGSLAAITHGAGWPVMMIIFGNMTNTFVQGPGGSLNMSINASQAFLDKFNDDMTRYALYYVYIGCAVFVASVIQSASWALAGERQIHRIQKQFFAAILRQEIGWFDVHQSGELTSRLAGDLVTVKEGMGVKLSYAIQFTAAFFSGYIVGFWKGWKLTLVMMSVAPILAVMAALMSRMMASFGKREAESYAKAGSVAEEVLSCIRTVTSFNGQNQDLKRYETTLQESVIIGQKKSWTNGFMIGFTMFAMFGSYALALWFGSEETKKYFDGDGGMSPGVVLTVFFCVLIGTFSIGNISPHIGSISEARGAAGALIDIIDNIPSIDASSEKGKRLQNVRGEIELMNVHFKYPTRQEVPVLRGFNMSVQPGQTVALVGPSGCGKSTVVNLVQRFYDVESGTVTIDGEDIRNLNVRSLRENIGVVSQEPTLFGLTIKENILLGRPDATHEEMVQACRSANCHDFIMKLPKQYDTLVGERGAQLSGGQKQRVAIARALIRDPKILLLDEATSALDTASERIVQDALDKARMGRTTIVIAHRLSTIKNADAILVVQDGRIVETGKHAELMAKQGEYYQLVTVQAIVEEEQVAVDDNEVQEEDLEADTVPNGVPRKRTISDGKTNRQSSRLDRQASKQVSRQASKPGKDGQVEDEEKETAGKAGWCAMMHENQPECGFIILGCFAAAINGCTFPAFAFFFGEVIQVFVDHGKNNLLWSMMFLALGGTQLFTNTIQQVCYGYSGQRLTKRLREKTFKAYLRQDISYFDDPKHSTGALTTRLSTDAAMIQTATGVRLSVMIQSLFSLVAALFIAFYYGWQLALVVLGAVPLMALAGAVQLKTVMATQKKDNVNLEKAGKTSSEAVDNIRTVQALAREQSFYKKYTKFLEEPYSTNMKMAFLTGLSYGFSQGIMFMLYGGCFRFGAYMISKGEMEAPDVFKVFFAISMTALVMGQSSSFLPDYSKAAVAAGIIFKTIGTVPPIDVFSKKGQWPTKMAGNISLKGVFFNYPSRPDVTVLKGINLEVAAGQTVALVGPSGCGKSTVVSLLQRYYDPSQGRIEVDGTDIKEINLVRLRYLISVVSQEPVLFDCSIKDNITYGLDSPIGMDEIIEAARAANIHEFISNLPMGYETMVGEKGTQLSGGQKQRVAIARALVRNPRILLLDEATSALDTESEKLVQAALDNAQEGRTCIVIAHRLSTIQNADVIYVIDSGNVVEYGNHQQLLNKKGVYAQLVSGQQLS